jgi:hypothetical protein
MLRMVELYLHSPVRIDGVGINKLSTRKTSPFTFTYLLIRVAENPLNTTQPKKGLKGK